MKTIYALYNRDTAEPVQLWCVGESTTTTQDKAFEAAAQALCYHGEIYVVADETPEAITKMLIRLEAEFEREGYLESEFEILPEDR